ncbi:hypothetical protein EYF80_007825 [Liparis tanakae]|uniref:Uncharacterized protein n=1 Tax=Liparis tanakae TaxID=230148 RepID=A0A4Z2IVZ5_9TELE|nr:hypothetical protein EYF80_007825 [Liparis tanakae]
MSSTTVDRAGLERETERHVQIQATLTCSLLCMDTQCFVYLRASQPVKGHQKACGHVTDGEMEADKLAERQCDLLLERLPYITGTRKERSGEFPEAAGLQTAINNNRLLRGGADNLPYYDLQREDSRKRRITSEEEEDNFYTPLSPHTDNTPPYGGFFTEPMKLPTTH